MVFIEMVMKQTYRPLKHTVLFKELPDMVLTNIILYCVSECGDNLYLASHRKTYIKLFEQILNNKHNAIIKGNRFHLHSSRLIFNSHADYTWFLMRWS